MALWQYTFIVIPKKNVVIQNSSTKLNEEYYYKTDFWRHGYEKDCFEELDKILLKAKSWSKNIIIFGKEDSNVLKLILDDKKVTEVILRIDFRTHYGHLLNDILIFCLSHKFILLDEDLNIMPFDSSAIVRVIENSPQYLKLKEMTGL